MTLGSWSKRNVDSHASSKKYRMWKKQKKETGGNEPESREAFSALSILERTFSTSKVIFKSFRSFNRWEMQSTLQEEWITYELLFRSFNTKLLHRPVTELHTCRLTVQWTESKWSPWPPPQGSHDDLSGVNTKQRKDLTMVIGSIENAGLPVWGRYSIKGSRWAKSVPFRPARASG